MNDKKIIISYEEYLELLKYKEMVEEAKKVLALALITLRQ